MYKKIILFLFTIAIFSNLPAQNQANLKKIDDYLTDFKQKIPIPGFSIVIIEDGKITLSKGYGVEKQGFPKPMTAQSSVGIGSIGRGFTAMAIMQLVEQGKVDLEEPVIKYLPWFKTANKNFSDQITVRMCLSNTSAIPAQFEAVPDLDPNRSLAQFVKNMDGYYVKRKPGLSHEFNDEGYSIAGLIISEISGLSYPEYIQKNILTPLDMKRSTTDPNQLEALGVLYGHEMGLTECIPAKKGTINGNYLPAGAEFRTSAEDLGHYLIALLNGGKYKNQQVLTQQSIDELFKSNASFLGLGTMLGGNGIDIQYCLGWMEMVIEDRNIILHTGNTGTMAAIAGIHRKENKAVAMLFNGDVNRLDRYVYPSLENTANNVIHILNGEATTDFAIPRFDDPFDEDYTLPTAKWEKYLGHYESYGTTNPFFKDIDIDVFVGESGKLELKAMNSETIKGHYILQFSNETRAALRNISHPREIQFKLFPDGSIGGLFMFGSEFKKREPSIAARFETVQSEANNLSFSFPKSVNKQWTGNTFQATFPKHPATTLTLTTVPLKSQTFEKFVTQQINKQSIISKGIIKKENLKEGIWTEQTVFTKGDEGTQQHLLVFYQDPASERQLQLVLTNPYGAFSSDLQELMMYFQKSIVLK